MKKPSGTLSRQLPAKSNHPQPCFWHNSAIRSEMNGAASTGTRVVRRPSLEKLFRPATYGNCDGRGKSRHSIHNSTRFFVGNGIVASRSNVRSNGTGLTSTSQPLSHATPPSNSRNLAASAFSSATPVSRRVFMEFVSFTLT